MTASSSNRGRAAALAIAGLGLILGGASLSMLVIRHPPEGKSIAREVSAVPAHVDFAAPELTLQDLYGRTGALADDRGKVILVNLWATWCPPCKAEMPTLQQFHTEHLHEGFTVIAINDGESATAVRRFADERGLTFPIWLDPKYVATEVAFRAVNLPTSYVIDRTGKVRLIWVGAINTSMLERYVVPLIEE